MNDWYTGREDMQSFDAFTGKPFASVYTGPRDENGETVAMIFGDDCKERARLIANAPRVLAAARRLVACPIMTHAHLMVEPQRTAFAELAAAVKASD